MSGRVALPRVDAAPAIPARFEMGAALARAAERAREERKRVADIFDDAVLAGKESVVEGIEGCLGGACVGCARLRHRELGAALLNCCVSSFAPSFHQCQWILFMTKVSAFGSTNAIIARHCESSKQPELMMNPNRNPPF